MHPFTVILGIITGSLVAIAFGLVVVLFVFWVLQGDHPRFTTELPALIQSAGIFVIMAAIAVTTLIGTLRRRPWRFAAVAVLAAGLLATGWHYWP